MATQFSAQITNISQNINSYRVTIHSSSIDTPDNTITFTIVYDLHWIYKIYPFNIGDHVNIDISLPPRIPVGIQPGDTQKAQLTAKIVGIAQTGSTFSLTIENESFGQVTIKDLATLPTFNAGQYVILSTDMGGTDEH